MDSESCESQLWSSDERILHLLSGSILGKFHNALLPLLCTAISCPAKHSFEPGGRYLHR